MSLVFFFALITGSSLNDTSFANIDTELIKAADTSKLESEARWVVKSIDAKRSYLDRYRATQSCVTYAMLASNGLAPNVSIPSIKLLELAKGLQTEEPANFRGYLQGYRLLGQFGDELTGFRTDTPTSTEETYATLTNPTTGTQTKVPVKVVRYDSANPKVAGRQAFLIEKVYDLNPTSSLVQFLKAKSLNGPGEVKERLRLAEAAYR